MNFNFNIIEMNLILENIDLLNYCSNLLLLFLNYYYLFLNIHDFLLIKK